jgi:inhibitor of cysteine peptidase
MDSARSDRRSVCLRRLAAILFLAAVCGPQMAVAATRTVTDAEKGGVIALKSGDVLEVRLSSNPSTGYRWSLHPNSTPLLVLLDESSTKQTEPGVGRPIFQVFRFQAKQRGKGVLLLHYVRSWEKPSDDERRFDLNVSIR